jgi:hypothetical protein
MNQDQTPFTIRAWGIRAWSDPDGFEAVVRRAADEAEAYNINTLDLHDGAVPPGIGLVDLFTNYNRVPALNGLATLTYDGRQMETAQRAGLQERFRDLCRHVKVRGLRTHVWYHVLRDLPLEWLEAEPTMTRLEGRRLWQVLGGILDDFLLAMPDVDAVTLSADRLLTGVRQAGVVLSGERLRAVYQCAYESCRRHRRQLVVREVSNTDAEREAFLYAIAPLPPDITIMVKDAQRDWYHLDAPPNPMLYRLDNKSILLETDLFGEHWGRLEVPVCRPRQIHRAVRSWVNLPIIGAVGRILVKDRPEAPTVHVFDTPGSANVEAFCRLLVDPWPDAAAEEADMDAFDTRIWIDWLHKRYGGAASPYVIAALDRTPRICRLAFYAGGAYFQSHSYLPDPSHFERAMWPTFVRQAQAIGVDVLRWEKEEAQRLVRHSLQDIEMAEATLDPADNELLLQAFEQTRDVILAYRALIGLCVGRLQPDRMPDAAREANDLTARLESQRGSEFFGDLPGRLGQIARYLQDVTRGVPADVAGIRAEDEFEDDGPIDLAGLGPDGGF